MLWSSYQLSFANNWVITNHKIRNIITDYGPSFILIICTIIVNLPYFNNVDIDKLIVPSSFNTTSNRPWIVPIFNLETEYIFFAIIPGLIISILFF